MPQARIVIHRSAARRVRYAFARCALVVLLLLTCARAASALDPATAIDRYGVDVWGTEHGLTSNSVQFITQTADGYLWLGTKGGLVRFDGVRFAVFDKINTKELSSNDVLGVLEDRRGRLWIGTDGGGLVRLEAGRLTRFTSRDGLPEDYVQTIREDGAGDIWAVARGKLSRFDGERFVVQGAEHNLPEGAVRPAFTDERGTLWVGTSRGLYRREGNAFVPSGVVGDASLGRIRHVVEAKRAGGLWLLADAGVYLLKDGRLNLHVPAARLPAMPLTKMCEDAAGNLWIGTLGAGLVRVAGGEVSIVSTANNLPNDYIGAIHEDREGNLWVGTYGGGLVRLKDTKVTAYSTRDGMSADFAFSIHEDRAGALWVGTHGGGVNRFHDGEFTAYTKKDGLSSDIVRAVLEDHRGRLWVGTEADGLNYLEGGRWRKFDTGDGLSGKTVTVIYEDRRGRLWVGTDRGLNLLRDGGVAPLVYTIAQGLPSDRIRALHEDRDGNFWIGTHGGGLARMTDTGFETFTSRDGLSDDFVRSIYEDADGALWLANYGAGVTRFKDNCFTAYTTEHGLHDNTVYQVLEDDYGNLWMSSNRGIFFVDKNEMREFAEGRRGRVTSIVFDASDGMRSGECNGGNQPAGVRTRDGKLWFPTIKGIVSIDPSRIHTNRVPPPIEIEQIVLDDRGVRADRLADYGAGRGTTVVVPPGSTRLEVHYTALSFYAPEKVRFKFKLEGSSDDWVEAGARRAAYFTNLPPGNYRFRVIASNNDGVWNEIGATLDLTLRPYFYQTGTFKALLALLLAASCAAIYKLRVRGMKRREQRLVRVVEERTSQLVEANATLTRLSNMDGLTGIANRRHFDDFLDREWRRAVRGKAPLTVVLIDVDYFKNYNDCYGHQQGDECLRWVARAIEGVFNRPGDLVARYGGEEFVAVFYGTPAHHALDMAEALRERVADLRISHAASPVGDHVTISLGAATITPAIGDAHDALVAAADRALYEAKQAGRDRVHCAAAAHAERI